ncbi:unnamed protein product [Darwinula stevensoni]|uniref:Uncharacterized protein n=1 Tax=Darwinula stevensoni TaxID=69355 RepID=A0A7R8XCV0_9CRUS|nr:unnamed protein product [Darwinula stevensoni]CAG0893679.1 unnamed protein product [Darwinula stevensoni]
MKRGNTEQRKGEDAASNIFSITSEIEKQQLEMNRKSIGRGTDLTGLPNSAGSPLRPSDEFPNAVEHPATVPHNQQPLPHGWMAPFPTQPTPNAWKEEAPEGRAPVAGLEGDVEEAEAREIGFGSSFSDKSIRKRFVCRVYGILSIQLVFTFALIALFVFSDGIKTFIFENMWMYWTAYGIFLVTLFVLICFSSLRRTYPANVWALAIFVSSVDL